jgi:hypothetical protein
MVSSAIAESGNQAINYFIAQEYTKAIGKFATSPNAKTILFPIEATQLAGTLGGIGELARAVLGDDAKGGVTAPLQLDGDSRAKVPVTGRK